MPFHLKTTKAVLIRKAMVGAAFFFFSHIALVFMQSRGWILIPAEVKLAATSMLMLLSFCATLLVKPADHAAKRVLRDYVLRRECYTHMALLDLAEELLGILNLRESANLVVNSFADAFHLKTAAFYVLRREEDFFEPVSAFGWPASALRRSRLSYHSLLSEILSKSGEGTLIRNALLKSVRWQDASNLEQDFNLIRAGWIMPFTFKGELLGFLAFGCESPDRTFDKADFEFFLRFGRKASISLKNALEFESLENCNRELRDGQSRRFQASKQKAVSQLAEGLAHEIHNPLTIISGKAQVLLFKKGENDWPKRVEEALTVIIQQSKRAADITRKVLAAVNESQAPLKELDLKQAALETANLLEYQLALKQIDIIVEGDEGLRAFIQPGDLNEIFSGMILSSAERIGSHGWIRILVRSLGGEPAAEIIVTESGTGAAAGNAEHLFDPFYKARHEDVGLGLWTVKQIVHRYGGHIRAESRQGEGLFFQIQLPLGRQTQKITPVSETAGQAGRDE